MRRACVFLSASQILALALVMLLLFGCREKPTNGAPPAKVDGASASKGRQSNESRRHRSTTKEEDDSPIDSDASPDGDDALGNRDPSLGIGYVDFSSDEAADEDTGVVSIDRERSYPGYNLIEVVKLRRAELVDADGKLVNVWTHGERGQWERCVLLANGDLLVLSFSNPHSLLRLSWDSKVVWQREGHWHHDVLQGSDGSVAAISWEYRRLPEISDKTEVMDNLITRFSPDGQSKEVRSLYDIFASRPDMFSFQDGRLHKEEAGRQERIDLIHANSLNWIAPSNPPSDSPIFEVGNVIVCCRHQDSVMIFNWETSKMLWVWGKGELDGPHDAQMLKNGNILVFDNGRQKKRSRVLEVNPLSKEIVWRYVAPNPKDFYSTARGASQRLPNENTLITESNRGRVFEVTPDGKIVWEYFNPHRDSRNHIAAINRCDRYEVDFVEPLIKKFGTRSEPPESSEKE